MIPSTTLLGLVVHEGARINSHLDDNFVISLELTQLFHVIIKVHANELHSELVPALSEATYTMRIVGSKHGLDRDVCSHITVLATDLPMI
jgi:hypothetical protein